MCVYILKVERRERLAREQLAKWASQQQQQQQQQSVLGVCWQAAAPLMEDLFVCRQSASLLALWCFLFVRT